VPVHGPSTAVLTSHCIVEVKREKNRLHLDLRTPDLEAEVSRVLELGAALLTRQPVAEDGWLWHILADPDGNEFCVLQPPGIPQV
jgi:predicted enzyme related to lactoylglutathione lyase